MTDERKKQYTLRITQANKTQMITILYEMVIDYIRDAEDAMSLGQSDKVDISISHAQCCIDELIRSVNLRLELGRNLHSIYIFSKKELMIAGISRSINRLWRVEQNFKTLCSAYREIEKSDTSRSTMDNTQRVYAGLTYGKNSLNEDVTALSMNRGYMA